MHLTVYAVAATGDPGLRRQVAITWLPTLAGGALLVAGALLGGWTQTLLFAGGILVEGVGVYVTSRHGSWRLHSVAHLTERHGLFMILAIGESVVAIGVGAASQPISAPLLVAAILGMAVAVCLWWLYFDVVSLAAEHRLLEARGQARVDLAGQLLFKRRMHNALSLPRLLAIGVLLAALPAAVWAPPLVGLAGVVLVLAALIVVETTRYAQARRDLRGA